ncbi:hypothetical protein [Pedobacter cryotolerans]|uniref:DUF3945 domain-containing protein n=1 Tax=Pedobacter cryotolerans TaxID=2571270 RepID=A0A4U1BVF4_9SPHI|nr:hypothetical protein [Pedobacter cryotolerans]TKB96160.1 hypothetical protein FA045_18635 [Pedobacter cryotolerans]
MGWSVSAKSPNMDLPWMDVTLYKRTGGVEIAVDLLVKEYLGKLRIPEYAVFVPKLLGNDGVGETLREDAFLLETDFRRTVGTRDEHGLFVEGQLMSAQATAVRCLDFLNRTDGTNERGLDHRLRVVSELCQSYPVGKEVAGMIYLKHPELRCMMNHRVQLPYTVRIGAALKLTGDIGKLRELGRNAYENENLKKAIMDAKNLENLKEEMVKLGFSENLIGQMEARMAANEPRFILYDELKGEKGRVEIALHFNQSKSSEYYYFNKFDLVKETQPPLAPGEKYFVSSQRQGEEVVLKDFEMPSLAMKEFNARMEASRDIRGAAQLYAGVSLQDSKELATMGDGKLINVDKEFYRALKNPAPGQTFYIEKGNGFTVAQGLNLLEGRSVYRPDMLDISNREYSAWVKLDFDGERDRGGNFKTKTFTEGYGFDLSAVLDRFDFRELGSAGKRAELEAALMNGDRAVVTVDMSGKKEAILAEAVPEFKQVNLYSLEGRSIKREEHLKEEKISEVSVGRDKSSKKEQEQGLGV